MVSERPGSENYETTEQQLITSRVFIPFHSRIRFFNNPGISPRSGPLGQTPGRRVHAPKDERVCAEQARRLPTEFGHDRLQKGSRCAAPPAALTCQARDAARPRAGRRRMRAAAPGPQRRPAPRRTRPGGSQGAGSARRRAGSGECCPRGGDVRPRAAGPLWARPVCRPWNGEPPQAPGDTTLSPRSDGSPRSGARKPAALTTALAGTARRFPERPSRRCRRPSAGRRAPSPAWRRPRRRPQAGPPRAARRLDSALSRLRSKTQRDPAQARPRAARGACARRGRAWRTPPGPLAARVDFISGALECEVRPANISTL